MLKVMVFIDQLNFYISSKKLYSNIGMELPRLDYTKIPAMLTKRIPNTCLVKTFVFAPKPDKLLLTLPTWENYNNWLDGLNNKKYFEIIKGEYQARPFNGCVDINDRSSYYLEEKGTDVYLAAHMLTKAFHNSFDIAILVSGDTDYLPVIEVLKTLGKITVIAAVEGQNLGRFIAAADDRITMDKGFFEECLLE